MQAILAPLALACGLAIAQQPPPIYRCGDSYGQQPCAGGRAIAPDSAVPSDAERRQSLAATRRDALLADQMEKERLAQEAKAHRYVPPPAAPVEDQAAPPPAKKAGKRKPDHHMATAGSKPTAKRPRTAADKTTVRASN